MKRIAAQFCYIFFLIKFLLYGSIGTPQGHLIIQPGPEEGKDARVWTLDPGNNFFDHKYTKLNAWTWSGEFGIERSFIEFDLAEIPSGAQIDQAFLSLYYHFLSGNPEQTHYGANKFLIQRTTSEWSEYEVTWNNQPAVSSQNQVEIEASLDPQQDYIDIDVTSMLIDALNYNSDSSFGMGFQLETEELYRRVGLSSSDHPNPSLWPKLEIFYSCFIDLGPDTTLCEGDTLILNAGSNYTDYLWSDNSIDSTMIITTTGTYWVEVWDGYDCNTSDTIYVSFAPGPEGLNIGNDTTICEQDSLLLFAEGGFDSYEWQDGSMDSTFLVTESGIYYVTVTNECGAATDSIIINLWPDLLSGFNIGNDTTLCFGESMLLSAGPYFDNYLWQDGSTGQNFNVTAPGVYHVTVSNICGQISDTINIHYHPEIILDFGNDTALCTEETLWLNAGMGFQHYLWQDGSTNNNFFVTTAGIYSIEVTDYNNCTAEDDIYVDYLSVNVDLGEDTSICENAVFMLSAFGNFTGIVWNDLVYHQQIEITHEGYYSVKVYDSVDQKYCFDYDTILILYKESPSLESFETEYQFCPGESISIEAPTGTGFQYFWSTGNTDPSIDINKPGTYFLTIQNECDTVITNFDVSLFPDPAPNILIDSILLDQGVVSLFVPEPFQSYSWSDGSIDNSIDVSENGIYFVSVENEYKCIGSDSILIDCFDCSLWVPAVFTPNADLSNDFFFVDGPNVEELNIKIINRWGEQVYESNDTEFKWDGMSHGQACAEGVYYYVVSFTCNLISGNKGTRLFTGNVTLLR
jgi:gliding motility-associated-like protein